MAGVTGVRVFAVERVFARVSERHEHETRRRRIVVGVSVADAADQLEADPARIEDAVEELFANALRATPDGGRIELRAKDERGSIVLSVIYSTSTNL